MRKTQRSRISDCNFDTPLWIYGNKSELRANEMFRQLQALALIVRTHAVRHKLPGGGSVSRSNTSRPMIWPCSRMKGTSRERTSSTARAQGGLSGLVAEAGIEEAGIVNAELADQRIERHHLGGVVRRDRHRLARRQDVELVRIEHDVARAAWPRSDPSNRAGSRCAAPVDIDQRRCAAWRASRCGCRHGP